MRKVIFVKTNNKLKVYAEVENGLGFKFVDRLGNIFYDRSVKQFTYAQNLLTRTRTEYITQISKKMEELQTKHEKTKI